MGGLIFRCRLFHALPVFVLPLLLACPVFAGEGSPPAVPEAGSAPVSLKLHPAVRDAAVIGAPDPGASPGEIGNSHLRGKSAPRKDNRSDRGKGWLWCGGIGDSRVR